MKLFDSLSGDQGEVFHLIASLSHRLARAAHLADQLLRRFSIFTQAFGRLFERAQDLANATLLLALEIGQFPDALAARHQVSDNHLKLTANRLVLLTFRTVNNTLQTGDQLVDFGLTIGTLFEEQAV